MSKNQALKILALVVIGLIAINEGGKRNLPGFTQVRKATGLG